MTEQNGHLEREEKGSEALPILGPDYQPSSSGHSDAPPLGWLDRWAAFWRGPVARTAMVNFALILVWYFFGTLLSLWNKLLLGKEHGLFGKGAFPAPFLMSSLQFFFQHAIARGVLALGWAKRKQAVLTWAEWGRTVVPNGVATGLDIGFSNYSLVFITLSFYVMCKSTTPLFLLAFAIAWGIEKPSWALAGVVAVITSGLLLLVAGETQFDLVGFILVMTAAMLAGLRWTITQVLLQGKPGEQGGHHGGSSPVEVLYQLTPVMGVTLLLISLVHERLWATLPGSPYFETPLHTCISAAIMFFGGLIAFSMVLAEFTLIANTSALTFMVAGTFKEIVTVGAAVLFLHEGFTWINGMGLLVLVLGVVLFNWMKYVKLKKGELRPLPLDGPRKHSEAVSELTPLGDPHTELELGGDGLAGSSSGAAAAAAAANGGGGAAPHHLSHLEERHAFLLHEDEEEQQLQPGAGSPQRRGSPRPPLQRQLSV